MKKKTIRILIACFVIFDIIIIGILLQKFYFKPVKAHYHAGFHVYVDNKLQDFSDQKYMSVEPCAEEGAHVEEDTQHEKAHLHDGVGNVVHSHIKPAIWGDLFKNINYSLNQDKPIKSFINGREVKDIETLPIRPYDSVIILIGRHDNINKYLKKAVVKEEILKAENKSETCGS